MTWFQQNAVAILVLVCAGMGIYVTMSNTDAVTVARLGTLEKSVEAIILQEEKIVSLRLAVNTVETHQTLEAQALESLLKALADNTRALNDVKTAVMVSDEKWSNHETRIVNIEEMLIPSHVYSVN